MNRAAYWRMSYFADTVARNDSDLEVSLNGTFSTAGYYLILHHAQAIFCMCMCEPAVPCQSRPAGTAGVGHWYHGLKKLFLDLLPVQSHLLCVFPLSFSHVLCHSDSFPSSASPPFLRWLLCYCLARSSLLFSIYPPLVSWVTLSTSLVANNPGWTWTSWIAAFGFVIQQFHSYFI